MSEVPFLRFNLFFILQYFLYANCCTRLDALLKKEVCCSRATSDDVLMLFFESRKRSGGGDIEEVIVNDDRSIAYITFKSAEGKLWIDIMI